MIVPIENVVLKVKITFFPQSTLLFHSTLIDKNNLNVDKGKKDCFKKKKINIAAYNFLNNEKLKKKRLNVIS